MQQSTGEKKTKVTYDEYQKIGLSIVEMLQTAEMDG